MCLCVFVCIYIEHEDVCARMCVRVFVCFYIEHEDVLVRVRVCVCVCLCLYVSKLTMTNRSALDGSGLVIRVA